MPKRWRRRGTAPFVPPDEQALAEGCYELPSEKQARREQIAEAEGNFAGPVVRLLPQSVPPRLLVWPRDPAKEQPTAGFVGLWEERGNESD